MTFAATLIACDILLLSFAYTLPSISLSYIWIPIIKPPSVIVCSTIIVTSRFSSNLFIENRTPHTIKNQARQQANYCLPRVGSCHKKKNSF